MPENRHSPLDAAEAVPRHESGALKCRRCQTVNSGGGKFLRPLRRTPLGTVRSLRAVATAGERFCGVCGTNLAAAVHQHTEKFEAALLTVEQLQAEFRFEEAVALLSTMSGTDHPRLSHHPKAAAELIQRLGAAGKHGLSQAEEAYQEARSRI